MDWHLRTNVGTSHRAAAYGENLMVLDLQSVTTQLP